jgi:hypothetical protein
MTLFNLNKCIDMYGNYLINNFEIQIVDIPNVPFVPYISMDEFINKKL